MNKKIMTSNDIRQSFIDFFKDKGHQEIPSSSLVPENDRTMLFTNAGMVQFKDIFLGISERTYQRAVSAQICMRAGGKHNDLRNVGYTLRHHTLFEMLGNFSFGDYFKRDAIFYAWEYLTKILNLAEDKLWVTVFEGDNESEGIWLNEINIDPKRISRISSEDNFWSMSDVGPCGPCSEIFYDHGESFFGSPPGITGGGDRYVEIWNMVFIQYNRLKDGTLKRLNNPSVDTGMGLERITAVMQDTNDNYQTDTFKKIISYIAKIIPLSDTKNPSLRVLADHIRACSFLIVDGVVPSNESHGHVLRRIIRRAIHHSHKLVKNGTLSFHKLVGVLALTMSERYPQIKEKQKIIEEVLRKEEEKFKKTLKNGLSILEYTITKLKSDTIPGDIAFKLYDTYGFPFDLTEDIAKEYGLIVDKSKFFSKMESQKLIAKSSSKFKLNNIALTTSKLKTNFIGYLCMESEAYILEILNREGNQTNKIVENEESLIVLDQTPFYAESGGQVGDKGLIYNADSEFLVYDVQKCGSKFLHIGKVKKGDLFIGSKITAKVSNNRLLTAANHTATHLLHAALRDIIGYHIEQKGSLVKHDSLRFDFSNPLKVNDDQIKKIEYLINKNIRENVCVESMEVCMETARRMGALGVSNKKHKKVVRVLSIGDLSAELCIGTHVLRTGSIGLFKIVAESGIASGIRRIEAVTGIYAEQYLKDREDKLNSVHALLKSNDKNVINRLLKLQEKLKEQNKIIKMLRQQVLPIQYNSIKEIRINDVLLVSQRLIKIDMYSLRQVVDYCKSKYPRVVVALSVESEGKVHIVVGISKSINKKMKAIELVNFIAKQVGGKGGGRSDMAQAEGNKPKNLLKAMASVENWVKSKIQKD